MKPKENLKGSLAIAVVVVVSNGARVDGQTEPTRIQPPTLKAVYHPVERGRHYRVMEAVWQTTNRLGQAVVVTNRYTVLGNGINYQTANGNWVDCQPVVQSLPEGIVCSGASYRVELGSNLNTAGVVDLETSDHKRIVSHPLGIGFFDPESGRSALLAQVKDSEAEVISNRIVFRDAFDGSGINASVTYRYEVGRFHQDVTFITRPSVTPADFGMGNQTRLELISEILKSPALTRSTHVMKRESDPLKRARMVEPDLVDETLKFGNMTMHLGRAFPAPLRESSRSGAVPVSKRLLNIDGRVVLVEALEWQAVEAALAKLPRPAADAASTNRRAGMQRVLPDRLAAQNRVQPSATRVAKATRSRPAARSAPFDEAKGFVLDYTLVDGSQVDWVFASGQTYLVQTACFLNDVSFESDAVIKFATGGLWVYGAWTNPTGSSRAILTAIDDDSAGATIPNSTGLPSGYYATPLVFDYRNSDLLITNLDIRYAYGGISVWDDYGYAYSIYDCCFFNCETGVSESGDTATTLAHSDLCNVERWTDGDVWTQDLTGCAVDRDSDGLPDGWEQQTFGSLSQTGGGDFDTDGMTNSQEYHDVTDPTRQDSNGDGIIDQPFEVFICQPKPNSTLP